jgi:hypothetical protein
MQVNRSWPAHPTSSDRRSELAPPPSDQPAPRGPSPRSGVQSLAEHADDRIWLRFDDRQFSVGAIITPAGLLPPQWEDLDQRGQFCKNRVHVVRAAAPDRVPSTTWNDPRRWCYQVDPEPPLERDADPTHLDIFDSWTCRTAIVRRILHEPS